MTGTTTLASSEDGSHLGHPSRVLACFFFIYYVGPEEDVSETSTWSSHGVSSYLTGQGPAVEFIPTTSYVSPNDLVCAVVRGMTTRRAHRPRAPLEADFDQAAFVTQPRGDPPLAGA